MGDPRAAVRVGIVGAGMMGMTHSLAWSNVSTLYWPEHPAVVKHRLADATEELAHAGAEHLGWANFTGDWREVTRANDIDVVDVVVPNALHHDVVVDAVRHGKHVICEKPLSTSLAEAREMLEEAERAGVVHQTGFVYRSFPGVALAQKLVADGRIGEVRYFRGQWLSDWAADPNTPHAWRFVRSIAGGGVLADTGSHVTDLARFVVGSEVSRVLTRSKTFITDRPVLEGTGGRGIVDTDDLTDILLEFENGVVGSICLARTYPGHNTDMGFEMVGSRGSVGFSWLRPTDLKFYSMDDPEELRGARTILIGKMHPNAGAFWGRGIPIGYSDAFLIQCHQLLRAIDKQDSDARATFRDGVRVAEVMEAALASAEQCSWIDVSSFREAVGSLEGNGGGEPPGETVG